MDGFFDLAEGSSANGFSWCQDKSTGEYNRWAMRKFSLLTFNFIFQNLLNPPLNILYRLINILALIFFYSNHPSFYIFLLPIHSIIKSNPQIKPQTISPIGSIAIIMGSISEVGKYVEWVDEEPLAFRSKLLEDGIAESSSSIFKVGESVSVDCNSFWHDCFSVVDDFNWTLSDVTLAFLLDRHLVSWNVHPEQLVHK
jgi:hypothetical protein